MGLVVNFPVEFEDRFCIALRDKKARNYAPTLNLDYEDVGEDKFDDNTRGCNYSFSVHPSLYNALFNWLSDVESIMGIPIKFRYAYSKKEAYTGYSDNNMYKHKWLKLF